VAKKKQKKPHPQLLRASLLREYTKELTDFDCAVDSRRGLLHGGDVEPKHARAETSADATGNEFLGEFSQRL
jgi:hypothetical protein